MRGQWLPWPTEQPIATGTNEIEPTGLEPTGPRRLGGIDQPPR
ncbi:hypothetical protein Pan181_07830 [Aeoliella mucimassa]|uniref:Uncharacterized protein n=1 Tax=Aeoliella mucimassa TaxID=2527972 RepID=A0A518AIS1_9BACT|nr:hypothetical protein Pan181_07830 [Aeoliella mucimassa]